MKAIRKALVLLVILVTRQVSGQVLISEFMAGGGTVQDENGDRPDWIEIWNASPQSVNLGGWHLTEDPAALRKWTFPATNLASGRFLVVFASGKDRAVAGAPLHTNFKLKRTGEYLALVEADGQTIACQYSPHYPEQFDGISYGLEFADPALPPIERYFAPPTPGATNSAGYAGVVADPQFSVARGFVEVPVSVTMVTATSGADLYFTTNGSAPTVASGMRYVGPITIDHSTVLRAMAAKPGYRSSKVTTHTYNSVTDVLNQGLLSATNRGFPATWSFAKANYAMDPKVTGSNAVELIAALRSLPSVYVATSVSNLFDRANGIYANANGRGTNWERPISLEWVKTNGQTEFQIDCGLRIQGGVSRSVAKHSFRVLFKDQYGAGTLAHDLFHELGATKTFKSLVLRGGFNDSWFWLSGSMGKATYLRDEFARRLQLAMGDASAHGLFVHLYLDGLYWGLYNVTERPDEHFSAAYYGGKARTWDANHAGEVRNGDMLAWNSYLSQLDQPLTASRYQQLQGNNPDGTRNADYPVYLDKLNYIDYLLLNFWGGNWDWPYKNFWYGRQRTSASTGFKFYAWDTEGIVDDTESPLNAGIPARGTDNVGVGQPHYHLKSSAEYRLDFADRVQRFFFNGGLLTPSVLTNRFSQLANSVQGSILAESARWGNGNLSVQSQTTWRRERDYILGTYLTKRSGIVLGLLRQQGLYPTVGAPVFSQFGGGVPARYGLVLSHTNASGSIYVTLDGSDPRIYGLNTAAPTAQIYAQPLILKTPTLVRARVLQGTNWSALVEAPFYPPQDLSPLLLNEIMYHPPDLGSTNGEAFEFVELKNAGTNALNLSGCYFSAGITFTFTNGTTLAPGSYFVLGRDPAAFAAKHPGVPLQGVYTGKLDNDGEELALAGPLGDAVFSFRYEPHLPWPMAADGTALSLQRLSATGDLNDLSNWLAAVPTPGRANSLGDTDGDGLPDSWEVEHGTDPWTPDADADPDHDGLTNLEEFLAGTDPNAAESCLRIRAVAASPGTVTVQFQAIGGHTYSLQRSRQVLAPLWEKVVDVPVQPVDRLVTLTNAVLAGASRFFRVVTPAQP